MAFDYYFAGGQSPECSDFLAQSECNILRSYAREQKDIKGWFERKKNGWKGKLLIDNGAFTFHRKGGKLDIDEFINWINENDEYFDYVIALDDIPGVWGTRRTVEQLATAVVNTYNNYLYMRERVKSPSKLLPVFHMGESFDWLRKYLEEFDDLEYMCISGNKELSRESRQAWYTQCFDVIKHSSKPNIKIHCLGSGTISDIEKFPFCSMDSTSYLQGSAFGELCSDIGRLYIGEDETEPCHVKHSKVKLDYLKSNCDKYGLDFDRLMSDPKYRLYYNIAYYIDKSHTTTTQYYNHKHSIRKGLL